MQKNAALLCLLPATVAACRLQSLSATHPPPVVAHGIAGVVFDSLNGRPVAGAIVQLVDAADPTRPPFTVTSDTLGEFAAPEVEQGRYVATFYHPRMDSLGLEPPTVLIDLEGPTGLWMDLSFPAGWRLRAMYCGLQSLTNHGGVMVGRAADARTREPMAGAVIAADWLDMGVPSDNRGVVSSPYAETVSRADGSFVLCGLPLGSDVTIQASEPDERSGTVDIRLPASGLVERDLLLGPVRPVVVRGNVVDGNGSPLPRARVSVANSPTEVVADENGVFTLTAPRSGTQSLLARAIGYYPQERAVDVVPDSAMWVELQLPSMVSLLDTVRVNGHRLSEDPSGFERRRAAGGGTFLTRADIDARVPRTMADLIQRSSATPLASLPNGHLGVRVRGSPCLPTLVLDGQSIPILRDLSEMDALVDLTRVRRVEIYAAGQIPRQFMRGNPCAAVVVWTRPPS